MANGIVHAFEHYVASCDALEDEFQNISLQSYSKDVCHAIEACSLIIQAESPEFTSALKQRFYDVLKGHLPAALKHLAEKTHQAGLKQLKITDIPSLLIEKENADGLKKELQTLTTVFKKTLLVEPTGYFVFLKKFFTWLFYARPVQNQIDKITKALEALDLAHDVQRKPFMQQWENDYKVCMDSTEVVNHKITAFKQKVCAYRDVIFPTSFIDTFSEIDRASYVLLKQLETLEKIGRILSVDREKMDKLRQSVLRIYRLFADFGHFYSAMTLFQDLHHGIQYRDLGALAVGDEIGERRHQYKKTISREQIEQALKYSFAWDKLHQFADFELRQILRQDISANPSLQTYIRKLKLLTEMIPQLRSGLINEATILVAMLDANEHPEAVANTVPPPAVEGAAPLSQEKKGNAVTRFFKRVFS